jgi:hypothetical protein
MLGQVPGANTLALQVSVPESSTRFTINVVRDLGDDEVSRLNKNPPTMLLFFNPRKTYRKGQVITNTKMYVHPHACEALGERMTDRHSPVLPPACGPIPPGPRHFHSRRLDTQARLYPRFH